MIARRVTVVAAVLFASLVHAHESPGYSHDGGAKTSNPAWMTGLRDDTLLSELSIPGTHDTMALYGGDITQTQTLTLQRQLQSGIRAFDMRCRHVADVFAMHHGMVFQNAYFGDVLNTIVEFLKKQPGEAVLMRVTEAWKPDNNTRSFEETFRDQYWIPYKSFFWQPTSENPRLGDIRGKIVVLQDFDAKERYGIPYKTFDIQDDYELGSNWDLYDKWTKVKAHLRKAIDGGRETKYMNYLSGSGGSFPYFVASGHSSPGTSAPRLATGRTTPGWKDSWPDFPRISCFLGICTIAFEGTNVLTYERLGKGEFSGRVGILMADFPGPGLIERTIRLNDRLK